MTEKEKLEMMELILKSNLTDKEKVFEIQSCLLGYITFTQIKELCEIVGEK